jgi:hypothetical protein
MTFVLLTMNVAVNIDSIIMFEDTTFCRIYMKEQYCLDIQDNMQEDFNYFLIGFY